MDTDFEKQFWDLYESSEDNKETLEQIIYEFDLETVDDDGVHLTDVNDFELVVKKFKGL